MFNVTKINTGPSYVKVKEERAPTDDAIRILKEMEEKITEKVLEIGRINDNTFNCKWSIISQPMDFTEIVYCKFTINGKEYSFNFSLPKPYTTMTGQEFAISLRDRIAERVVEIFARDLWDMRGAEIVNIYKKIENDQ